jgi:hypothetical protein
VFLVPYMRVDDETKAVVQKLQAFFKIAEGKTLTEGKTVKEVLKETAFEITGPDGKTEIIQWPFTQFEVKHIKSNGNRS